MYRNENRPDEQELVKMKGLLPEELEKLLD